MEEEEVAAVGAMADGGWRMADGGWKNKNDKMWMEKCRWKNADEKI